MLVTTNGQAIAAQNVHQVCYFLWVFWDHGTSCTESDVRPGYLDDLWLELVTEREHVIKDNTTRLGNRAF